MLEAFSNELETQRNNSSPAVVHTNKVENTPKQPFGMNLQTRPHKALGVKIELIESRNFNEDVPATPNYSAFISDAIEIAESRLNLDFNPDVLFCADFDTPVKRKTSVINSNINNNQNVLLKSTNQPDPMRSSLMGQK